MKLWGILVAVLYLLILIMVVIPLTGLFGVSASSTLPWWQNILGAWKNFFSWFPEDAIPWVYLGVMLIAQGALLSVPVEIAQKRPVTRRTVVPLVAASSSMMGLLAAGVFLAVNEVVRGAPSFTNNVLVIMYAVSLLVWFFWAVVFYRWSKKLEPRELLRRQCGYLLKGSILELLIAVPAHIVARQRTDCCAGLHTFIGITFGISVMLCCFGPGVFFLFVERLKYLHRKR